MTNHLIHLSTDLRALADKTASTLTDAAIKAAVLSDAAKIIEALPCEHDPTPGVFDDQSRAWACSYCGVPMKRVWIVADSPADAEQQPLT